MLYDVVRPCNLDSTIGQKMFRSRSSQYNASMRGDFFADIERTPFESTLEAPTPMARLERALDNIIMANTPELFAGKYVLLSERVVGGQGLVLFARSSDGGFRQFAIKCATKAFTFSFMSLPRLYLNVLVDASVMLPACTSDRSTCLERAEPIVPSQGLPNVRGKESSQ
jgi:hypothetical protein